MSERIDDLMREVIDLTAERTSKKTAIATVNEMMEQHKAGCPALLAYLGGRRMMNTVTTALVTAAVLSLCSTLYLAIQRAEGAHAASGTPTTQPARVP